MNLLSSEFEGDAICVQQRREVLFRDRLKRFDNFNINAFNTRKSFSHIIGKCPIVPTETPARLAILLTETPVEPTAATSAMVAFRMSCCLLPETGLAINFKSLLRHRYHLIAQN